MLTFARLPEIPLAALVAHMNDPRVARHLPLLDFSFDHDAAVAFVAAKEERWRLDGLGHGAFMIDGVYAGWGGFQKECGDWDLGLVLTSDHFGAGPRILRRLLEIARADARIPSVTFLLAPSRRNIRGLARLGAVALGETCYGDASFLKFRLDTPCPTSGAGRYASETA